MEQEESSPVLNRVAYCLTKICVACIVSPHSLASASNGRNNEVVEKLAYLISSTFSLPVIDRVRLPFPRLELMKLLDVNIVGNSQLFVISSSKNASVLTDLHLLQSTDN